jgi:hypothetical protein
MYGILRLGGKPGNGSPQIQLLMMIRYYREQYLLNRFYVAA